MMHRVTIAVAVGLLGAAFLAGDAAAEQADREVARVHFERGVALYEAGSYQEALDEFQAAYEAQPHPAVLVNIANCYARTNRPVRALDAFERYLRERGSRVEAAERREIERTMAEQARLVGELRIAVPDIEGQLLVDGLPVGSTPTEHVERVQAGSHRIEVRPTEGAPLTREVSVEGGSSVDVRIAPQPVAPVGPGPGPGPAVGPTGPEPEPGGGGGVVEPEPVTPPPPPTEPESAMAVLSITGTRGARVYVDGERVGRIPYEGEVEPGEHDIRLSGPGLLTYESALDFAPRERTEVQVDLARGGRPGWVPWVEWGLMGLAGALIIPGAISAGVGWARYVDSEAMFQEIDGGRYSSRVEEDRMWARYDEMYSEYYGLWQGGWAMMGIGIAAAVASSVVLILDHAVGMFSGRPQAEIDIAPIEEEP